MDERAVAAWLEGYSHAWGPTTPRRSGRCSARTRCTSTIRSPSRSGAARRSSPTGYATATSPTPTRAPTARSWSPATRRWQGYSRYLNTNGSVRDEYDNLFLLRFDADGRCAEYREWYMRKPRPEDG